MQKSWWDHTAGMLCLPSQETSVKALNQPGNEASTGLNDSSSQAGQTSQWSSHADAAQPCIKKASHACTAALPYRTMHDRHIAQNLAKPRNQSFIQPSQSKCQPASHSKASNPADEQQANLIRFNKKRINQQHNTQAPKPASQNCRQQTKQAN